MYDRDAVIRHCVDAEKNNASIVGKALDNYLKAETSMARSFAEQHLRDALVAQSVGHDGYCGNGATVEARVKAAVAALEAWDGPATPELAADQCVVLIPGLRLPEACSRQLAQAAGFEVRGGVALSGLRDRDVNRAFAIALSEGLRGNAALVRAIAVREQYAEASAARCSAEIVAEKGREAAAMNLAAEREATKRGR